MDSSEDEGEFLPDSVTDYRFVNDKDDPICFSCLPLQWVTTEEEDSDAVKMKVYLHGACGGGFGLICKQVVGWRYELSGVEPGIFVLCKGKQWVKLGKPRKRFEGTTRAILVTVGCLHFVRRNPAAGKDDVWRHLSGVFSSSEVGPSEEDILCHIALIRDAVKMDEQLATAKYMLDILAELPRKTEQPQEDGQSVDANFTVKPGVDDLIEYGEEDELFDTCCSLCDNGGDILCCIGKCMRSFHPSVTSGEGNCESLGLSDAEVEALPYFMCKNCKYEQHQCFLCGKLGSSTAPSESSCAEVIRCDAATCGRFYHPRCIATVIHRENDSSAEELEKKIAGGQSFTCPAHKCFICKQVEERKITSLQFAVCRRCPKAYHQKCLPGEIVFDDDKENNILQRAWDDLLPKRILIYCLDHEIIPELGTPSRDHILFPGTRENKRKYDSESIMKGMPKKKRVICALSSVRSETKIGEQADNRKYAAKGGASSSDGCGYDRRREFHSTAKSMASKRTSLLSIGNACAAKASGSKLVPSERNFTCSKATTSADLAQGKFSGRPRGFSSQVERRVSALIKEVDSTFNKNDIMRKLKIPTTYLNSRGMQDKNATTGKVEAAVEAVRRALQKLEGGCSIEDAMAVCGPEVLHQISRWKHKFQVYLAPFLYGMRYSSYGRHFTKLEKLQEIVNRLHWYVQDGDTIVDFCCGANDFSCLMKEKLENTGKRCSFKNFDLFPPHNKFSFDERDWFTVGLEELPDGAQLIMGLNPPFGVKGSLANKFINKALSFKPKLIVLIVPRETERLDEKRFSYDLIWEDRFLLSGKSFYLPGSVDVHDKQLDQWNNNSPPLYLWSRADWTGCHREIARQCGHLLIETGVVNNGAGLPPVAWNYTMEGHRGSHGDVSTLINGYGDPHSLFDVIPGNIEDNLRNYWRKLI